MSELASYVVYGVFVFAIGVQMLHFSHNFILAAVLVGLATESIVVPIAGAISDRVGRKRMFMFGVVLYGIWGFVYFAGLSTGSPAIVALVIALSFIPHGIQYGPQGALIAENFPARIRYSSSSIGYQLAHRGRRLGSLHCNRTAGPGPQWLSGRRLPASVLCH